MMFPAAAFLLLGSILPSVLGGDTTIMHLRGVHSDPIQKKSILVSNDGGFDLGANATFILETGDDLTTEEQMFVKYSVRRAYNTIHNNNVVVMQFTDMTSQEKTPLVIAPAAAKSAAVTAPVQAPSRRDLAVRTPFNWVLGFVNVGNCRLCRSSPTAVAASVADKRLSKDLEDSRANWALALCEELNQGSFEALQAASNCTIDYFLPDNGINDGVEEAQLGVTAHFTMPLDRDLTINEELFANECMRLSYNEVHDPSNVFMETASVTNQAYLPGDGPQEYSWTLDWTSLTWFRGTSGNDDDNGSRSLVKVNLPFGKLGEQQHIHWQVKFCEKLQAGPFEPFQSASNCLIVVNNAGELDAAVDAKA